MSDFTQAPPMATPVDGPLEPTSQTHHKPSPEQSAADNPAPSVEPEATAELMPNGKAKSRKILELFRIPFRFEVLSLSELIVDGKNRKQRDPLSVADLEASIRRFGILEPLITSPRDEQQKHRIIAGEGRYAVAKKLNLTAVPCMVAEQEPSEAARLWIQRDENACTEELNPMDRAWGVRRLLDALKKEGVQCTQEFLAEELKTTQSQVSTYLKLTRLSEAKQAMVRSGGLTVKQATRKGKGKVNSPASKPKVSGKGKTSETKSHGRGKSPEPKRSWPDADSGLEIQVHSGSAKVILENLVPAVKRWLTTLEAELAAESRR